MSIKSFPASASDLIEDIKEKYPNTCMRPDETKDEHLRRAGVQDCITWLEEWQDAANRAATKE